MVLLQAKACALLLLLLLAGTAFAEEQTCYVHNGSNSSCSVDYFNEEMNAYNVFEATLDPKVVLEIRADYEKDVRPHLETGKSTDDFCLVTPYNPGTTTWDTGGDERRSDIKWYSVNNKKVYEKYLEHVKRLGLIDIVKKMGWINSDKLTVYAIFLIVRGHSEKLQMHLDWSEEIHTQVVTFLVPLADFHIGMIYEDKDGEYQSYDYELGKAVGLGGGFMHSTGIGHGEKEDVLLCAYIGSDDPEIWDFALNNIDDELEHYMSPIDGFIRNENLEGGPSKCQ